MTLCRIPLAQLIVVQWDAAQRQDTALMLASVLGRVRRLGTPFLVLLNKADQVISRSPEAMSLQHRPRIIATCS